MWSALLCLQKAQTFFVVVFLVRTLLRRKTDKYRSCVMYPTHSLMSQAKLISHPFDGSLLTEALRSCVIVA